MVRVGWLCLHFFQISISPWKRGSEGPKYCEVTAYDFMTFYDFTAYKCTAHDFTTYVLQPVENVSVSQGLVKGAKLCLRNPYFYFRHGESTSTASQLTSPASQKSKDLNKVPLLLQDLALYCWHDARCSRHNARCGQHDVCCGQHNAWCGRCNACEV